MGTQKKEPEKINLSDLKPDEKLKYEIATELGLLDKVMSDGWKTLSAKETGRIGGIMTKRKKQMQMGEINKQ
ncbi:MAG: small, acid-soluble spore protein, alpha/beta type [Anaerocolumna sp.]